MTKAERRRKNIAALERWLARASRQEPPMLKMDTPALRSILADYKRLSREVDVAVQRIDIMREALRDYAIDGPSGRIASVALDRIKRGVR